MACQRTMRRALCLLAVALAIGLPAFSRAEDERLTVSPSIGLLHRFEAFGVALGAPDPRPCQAEAQHRARSPPLGDPSRRDSRAAQPDAPPPPHTLPANPPRPPPAEGGAPQRLPRTVWCVRAPPRHAGRLGALPHPSACAARCLRCAPPRAAAALQPSASPLMLNLPAPSPPQAMSCARLRRWSTPPAPPRSPKLSRPTVPRPPRRGGP